MKGMLYRKCKRPAAAILAAVMVLTAVNLPETSLVADAAAGWVWNATYSETGYKKATVDADNVVADSQQESGESSSVDNNGEWAKPVAKAAVDGCASSYWHSNYGTVTDSNHKVEANNGSLTNYNTITLPLSEAQTISGVTYLPRQDAMGNGPWTKFKVQVWKTDSTVWENVSGGKSDACTDVTVDGDFFKIDYETRENNWGGNNNNNHKFEREILFAQPIENVEKVKFTIVNSTAGNDHATADRPNAFLSAAEIGVLSAEVDLTMAKTRLRAKIDEMNAKSQVGYVGLGEFISTMEAVYNNDAASTDQVIKAIGQINTFEYKFVDDKGEGKYLSDLQEEDPVVGWGSYRKDINVEGDNEILLCKEDGSTKTYKKGIGLHSKEYNGGSAENPGNNPAKAVYNVSGYNVFAADIGIDARVDHSDANVIFKVLLSYDGSHYTEVYSSEEMTNKKAAKHIEIKLLNAQKMKIVVDSNGVNWGDHAVWADAKLYKTYSGKAEEKELRIISAVAGSEENGSTKRLATYACDQKIDTFWHTKFGESCDPKKSWIDFELENVSYVDAVSMYMRIDDGGTGAITKSEIWVSENGHSAIEGEADDAWKADYTKVAFGEWNINKKNLKTIHFDPVKAKHVRVVATEMADNKFAAMREFKAYGTSVTEAKTAPAPQFIDFLGGSLRTTPNNGDYTKANMRFGYEIATKNDAVGYKTRFEKWGFYYSIPGSTVYEVKGTNRINAPTREGFERSNLVITNIPSTAYKTNVTCGCYVTYALDNNEEVTLYSSETGQTRNVETVATHVYNNTSGSESEANRNYAYGILQEINKQP